MTAPDDVIRARYFKLVRQFHPDRSKNKELASRMMSQINIAYRILRDRQRRADYDLGLNPAEPPATPFHFSTPPADSAAPPERAPTVPQALDIAAVTANAQNAYIGGDHATARRLCEEVLTAHPTSSLAHRLIGDVCADRGQWKEALAAYEAAQRCGDGGALIKSKISRAATMTNAAQNRKPVSASPVNARRK